MNGLETPLKAAIGTKSANALQRAFEFETVGDLLHHFPRRYAHRGELTDLANLAVDDHVTVMADVAAVTRRPMRSKRGSLLEVTVTDGAGTLKLTFFNQEWRASSLTPGRRGLFSGKVTVFNGTRQLAHPTYVLVPADTELDPEAVAAFARPLIPVYPATSSLASWAIERAVNQVLDALDPLVKDAVPAAAAEREGFPSLVQALKSVHQPATVEEAREAAKRFAYEEALAYQTVLARRRREVEGSAAVPRPRRSGGLLEAFDARLPFALTAGQEQVCDELFADLAQSHPMHRLLQGEVGSGKTVCALRAMLAVVDAGGQAALLAPTEVLAMQHHRSIQRLLGDLASANSVFEKELGTQVVLLTGSSKAAARRETLLAAQSGQGGIVIGTHALLEDRVQFADLGLVVVDEQHRFGVEQRALLAAKAQSGTRPHVLVMTATPIPRTVAMTVFGDLDISVLAELPAGRSPIATHVVPELEKPVYLERAWQRVREEVAAGRQAYVVCPKINPTTSEEDGETEVSSGPSASVIETHGYLAAGPLAGLRLGLLHGGLPAAEKDEVMSAFAAGSLDVLVATTVIEVGVDVPNATAMVVLDADRFGVSQLHQLRGRVGRGGFAGLCLLVSKSEEGSPARQRLDAVAATTDGFELSRVDLEARREGDVLGAAQSGRKSSLRLLNVMRDEELIAKARQDAEELVAVDPRLVNHLELRRLLLEIEPNADFLDKS